MKQFLFLLGMLCLTSSCHLNTNKKNTSSFSEASILIQNVIKAVKENHWSPRNLDNDLSKDMYALFLEYLDPDKIYFTQKDLAQLQPFEFKLDEELKTQNIEFLQLSQNLLRDGINKAEIYCEKALNSGINLDTDETFETDPEKLNFSKNDRALKSRWQQLIQHQLLKALLLETQKNSTTNIIDSKKVAIQKVRKIMAKKFQLANEKVEEIFVQQYVNSFLHAHDRQSEYLSPKEKAAWNAAYTRTMVGIGTQIEIVDAHPKIKNVLMDGPAWKTKQIEAGDIILSIENEDASIVETTGLTLKETINLLKGEAGTEVRVTLKKQDHSIQELKITRAKMSYDLAKACVLQDNKSNKSIAYIRLPRFYAGSQGSSEHVLNFLNQIKSNNIDGLIFDVRNNQGGSSGHARSILGYFTAGGTMMQSQYNDQYVDTYFDEDEQAQFDGQLVVLVNARSASASELLAASIQDYKRGIVVGSNQTFGKGSMQRFVELTSSSEENTENEPLNFGEIKMSSGRFYSAAGRSPQYHGISPDIILPDDYSFLPSGERLFKHSIEAGSIASTIESPQQEIPNLEQIKSNSQQRVKSNRQFQLATQKARALKKEKTQSVVSLNFEKWKTEQEIKRTEQLAFEKIYQPIDGFKASTLSNKITDVDSLKVQKEQEWMEDIQEDPYIYECYQILNEMMS